MLIKSFWVPLLSIKALYCVYLVILFLWQNWVKMAEGSRDQGGVGTTDPEEDSPNMIVYRKARLTLCVSDLQCMMGETFAERQWPVDRLLTAHWSVSVCISNTLVSLSNSDVRKLLFEPSWNKLNSITLSGSSSYHRIHQANVKQCLNKLSISSVRVQPVRGRCSVKSNYLVPMAPHFEWPLFD